MTMLSNNSEHSNKISHSDIVDYRVIVSRINKAKIEQSKAITLSQEEEHSLFEFQLKIEKKYNLKLESDRIDYNTGAIERNDPENQPNSNTAI